MTTGANGAATCEDDCGDTEVTFNDRDFVEGCGDTTSFVRRWICEVGAQSRCNEPPVNTASRR